MMYQRHMERLELVVLCGLTEEGSTDKKKKRKGTKEEEVERDQLQESVILFRGESAKHNT